MHMPGHKRNATLHQMGNPYEIDITEIKGFDNLYQAEGILRDLSERISSLYLAGKSYPLVNGSTVGILAGILAATNPRERILIARNSHKSVYHGVLLRELEPVYIYPQQAGELPIHGGYLPYKIEDALIKHPDIRLVVITSPSYEGVVSDITEIARIVHRHGALLMVDEAHGAHFGFHEYFPKSAITLGADLVVQSLHKTLPSFTQTAILHSNVERLNKKVELYLGMLQSSSPSYVLMAGIDRCISLLEEQSERLFEEYAKKLESFYAAMGNLKKLFILNRQWIGRDGIYALDPSKLVIFTLKTAYNGIYLSDALYDKYKIVMEMTAGDYTLGMTSISDKQEGFDRLVEALLTLDHKALPHKKNKKPIVNSSKPVMMLAPYKALEKRTEVVPVHQCPGRIAATYVSFFPPGIPVLVPGEKITGKLQEQLLQALEDGLTVTGLFQNSKDQIEVICD